MYGNPGSVVTSGRWWVVGTLDSLTRSRAQCSAVSIPGGPELVAANNANKILSISTTLLKLEFGSQKGR